MVQTLVRKAFDAVAVEMVMYLLPWTTWLNQTLWFMEILECSYCQCLFLSKNSQTYFDRVQALLGGEEKRGRKGRACNKRLVSVLSTSV